MKSYPITYSLSAPLGGQSTCECGCGGVLKPNTGAGRPRRFLPGHWKADPSRYKKTKRERFVVTIYGKRGGVFAQTVSARSKVEAVSRVVAEVPLEVVTIRVDVDGEQLYPYLESNSENGVGRPYEFKTTASYSLGINTSRAVRFHIEEGKRGDFVDAAIREKLKTDLGVEL